ncbi:MAG: MFS transporter [Anaerolineae bacterium]|nr:MFS transporter [Anaerolineae bacterium]
MVNRKRELPLLFLFVFVDVLGFSLILPLLPYYAATFGATAEGVGLLLGANALTQLLGAPVLGRLSDRYGRKPLLLLSLGGTLGLSAALNSLTRVVAPTVGGFLLGRVGAFAPGALGALLMGWLVYYTWKRVLSVPDLACPTPRGMTE